MSSSLEELNSESKAQFQALFINTKSKEEAKDLALITQALSSGKEITTQYLHKELGIINVVACIQKLRDEHQINIQYSIDKDGDPVYILPKGLCCGVSHEH